MQNAEPNAAEAAVIFDGVSKSFRRSERVPTLLDLAARAPRALRTWLSRRVPSAEERGPRAEAH